MYKMENTQYIQVVPQLDISVLNNQLKNYHGKISLSIDTAGLQNQLQSELAKAAKIPIQLELAMPPASSMASSAISSFQTILPQFLSASGVG